ncbi:hypothetical protein AMTRI_Chr13g115620 [Amborella trichopoda]|uniref:Uncharacterized protein n=2 Tax=Amborella trichopoda TaxID=13333 RepID=W1NYB1_AMBTC|nr:hypothetical protein AMTR_s00111p00147130 [Amborella trichopoda]
MDDPTPRREAEEEREEGRVERERGAQIERESGEIPFGLSGEEYQVLGQVIEEFHNYRNVPGKCSSLMVQRMSASAQVVWSIVRRFERPLVYKHFIKSCRLLSHGGQDPAMSASGSQDMTVGCLREVTVISGLPATASTERLDILDDDRRVTGFTIVGGEHRLRNYRSVTTVNEFGDGRHGGIWTVVLESYVVDVPEGNTEEDTRLFADTVVRLNLQKLAAVSQAMAMEEREGERGE